MPLRRRLASVIHPFAKHREFFQKRWMFSEMFCRRQYLEIVDIVMIDIFIEVVDVITFGDRTFVKYPNITMQIAIASGDVATAATEISTI